MKNKNVRLVAHKKARVLSADEIKEIGGGTTSCCSGKGDDCDVNMF